MNALNILSGLNSPPLDTPPRSRTPSSSNVDPRGLEDAEADKREDSESSVETLPHDTDSAESKPESDDLHAELDEKTPLLQQNQQATEGFQEYSSTSVWRIPKRISNALFSSFEIVLATITAPARYLVACFYDDQGSFSALLPIRRLDRMVSRRKRRKSAAHTVGPRSAVEDKDFAEKPRIRPKSEVEDTPGDATLSEDTTDTVRSDSDAERPSSEADDSPFRNTRSKSAPRDEIAPPKKSIRISLHNDAALKKRHRLQKSLDGSPKSEEDQVAAVANSLKSPSSPAFAPKLKYPRAPAPPRPLVPRRHPSYTVAMSTETPKKTLVIDLDETLIHSMAKGGRMSTGHMVEVKFQGPIGGGGIVLGPQVPILYYVHERPHCHEFLRKICKWYNLVVFTASVQEYADPVIDWLERERAYFSARYYRQHCTLRNGAYIKDLSQVEPDLSKVMILDNSPMSYIFHEDNAIPIEGWISDPTDNDLLHLVPLLEGLQYVTDVRALLALRLGQAERA